MVLTDLYEDIPFKMRILHDHIRERELAAHELGEDPLFYTVKVLQVLDFIKYFPADKFYLDFREIFGMFNLLRLKG